MAALSESTRLPSAAQAEEAEDLVVGVVEADTVREVSLDIRRLHQITFF